MYCLQDIRENAASSDADESYTRQQVDAAVDAE